MIRYLVFCSLVFMAWAFSAPAQPMAHMVFFTLADDTPDQADQLATACQEHLSGHEGVTYFSVGVIADDLQRDVNDRQFDVALHLVFDDKTAHDKYQVHPRHLKFIAENKQLWSSVRVFDSYLEQPADPDSIDQNLRQSVTVEFKQLSLHDAAQQIQAEFSLKHPTQTPLTIEIIAADLQREGITLNQMIRSFSQQDQPLADVLTQLVKLANPIRNVVSLADRKQSLVWVVAPNQKSILITTRSAAKQKSYSLPSVFRTP